MDEPIHYVVIIHNNIYTESLGSFYRQQSKQTSKKSDSESQTIFGFGLRVKTKVFLYFHDIFSIQPSQKFNYPPGCVGAFD